MDLLKWYESGVRLSLTVEAVARNFKEEDHPRNPDGTFKKATELATELAKAIGSTAAIVGGIGLAVEGVGWYGRRKHLLQKAAKAKEEVDRAAREAARKAQRQEAKKKLESKLQENRASRGSTQVQPPSTLEREASHEIQPNLEREIEKPVLKSLDVEAIEINIQKERISPKEISRNLSKEDRSKGVAQIFKNNMIDVFEEMLIDNTDGSSMDGYANLFIDRLRETVEDLDAQKMLPAEEMTKIKGAIFKNLLGMRNPDPDNNKYLHPISLIREVTKDRIDQKGIPSRTANKIKSLIPAEKITNSPEIFMEINGVTVNNLSDACVEANLSYADVFTIYSKASTQAKKMPDPSKKNEYISEKIMEYIKENTNDL